MPPCLSPLVALRFRTMVGAGRKELEVKWDQLCQQGEAIEGLDDVIRLDLAQFCRKMEPSQEAYYR